MSQLKSLFILTDAMYLRSQQALKSVLAKEAQLRGELKKLDDHARSVRTEQAETIDHMRAIGADLLWEGWLTRTRAQLNLELAKTMAQKEQHIGKVRKSFGKKIVSERLLQQEQSARSKMVRLANLSRTVDYSIRRNN